MTYIPQPTRSVQFGWSPRAYVAIMKVDLDQAKQEISLYSHESSREEQVYSLQETLRFSEKVVSNIKLALQMLNEGSVAAHEANGSGSSQ
jgi:hypothetical protein